MGMKWFQIKIIHRCIGTNIVLQKMGVTENDLCNFCNTSKDSIIHMFWQCIFVQRFWNELADLMNEKCFNAHNMHLTCPLVLFGQDENVRIDKIVYFIILYAKQFIYKCKLEKQTPVLQAFLKILKHRYYIEEFVARKNYAYHTFVLEWAPYKPLIINDD